MMTRELARLISTLGKLPREQRYAVVTEGRRYNRVHPRSMSSRLRCRHCLSARTAPAVIPSSVGFVVACSGFGFGVVTAIAPSIR